MIEIIPKTESNIAETMYVGNAKVMICTDSILPKEEQKHVLKDVDRILTKIWHSLTPEQQMALNEKDS